MRDWLHPIILHPHYSVELTDQEHETLLTILDSELDWMDREQNPSHYKLVHKITCKVRKAKPEL